MDNIKNKKVYIVLIILDTIAVLSIMLFLGNFFSDHSINQKENNRMIGMSYMTMNNEFFRIISEEINAKIETEGDQVIIRDPALDSNRQIEQINEMIDSGVDALIINPVDWKALKEVLQKAKNQGIIIINVDSDVFDENLTDATIKSDNYQAGQIVGNYFLTQHPTANVVLLTHEVAKSSQDRIQGFLDTVSTNPNIKVVERIDCQGQTEIAMPMFQDFLSKNIPFDTVFCLNDLASLGVVAALDKNNMLDQVKVYGVDATPDSKALIYEGMMEATAAQFPTEIGSKTGEILYDLFEHKKVEEQTLVPVKLITKDNVSSLGIDRWQ